MYTEKFWSHRNQTVLTIELFVHLPRCFDCNNMVTLINYKLRGGKRAVCGKLFQLTVSVPPPPKKKETM